MMKIVADQDIAFVKDYFGSAGELILKHGRSITRDDLMTADMLLVRSVTEVNQALLQGTPVQFVGSATTGIDHLDTNWLNHAGIPWCAATGCNTTAVAEYVISAIASLQKMEMLPHHRCRVGVIGVGRIGSQVVDKLKLLGFDVVLCDPLRALTEGNFISTPLEEFADLDLVTLHTPLTREVMHATYHLIDKNFLQRQKKNCVLINTSRGAVIDFSDLNEYGRYLYWCLDVWENEPLIDFEVLQTAVIATPHIAGYSLQSKCRGIDMLYQAASQLGFVSGTSHPLLFPRHSVSFNNRSVNWRDVLLKIYDPHLTTAEMQLALLENNSAETFDALRLRFQGRHEFGYIDISEAKLATEDRMLLKGLGFSLHSGCS